MADFGVNVVGIRELQAKLANLEKKERVKFLRKSLTKGAALTRKAMRRNAPVGPTKNLRRSIKSKVRVREGGRIAYAVITPRHEIAPHRHLVIRGTKLRSKKSGQSTGRMTVNDFVGETFEQTERQAGELMLQTASRLIEEAWSRGS